MDPATPNREDEDMGEVVIPWSPKRKVQAAFTRHDVDHFFAPKRYYTKRVVRRGKATSGQQRKEQPGADQEVSLLSTAPDPSLTLAVPAAEPCRKCRGL